MLQKKLSTLRNILEGRLQRASIPLSYEGVQDILHYLSINQIRITGFISTNGFTYVNSEDPKNLEKRIKLYFKPSETTSFEASYTLYGRTKPNMHYIHLKSQNTQYPKRNGWKPRKTVRDRWAVFRYKVNAKDIHKDLLDLAREKHNL